MRNWATVMCVRVLDNEEADILTMEIANTPFRGLKPFYGLRKSDEGGTHMMGTESVKLLLEQRARTKTSQRKLLDLSKKRFNW